MLVIAFVSLADWCCYDFAISYGKICGKAVLDKLILSEREPDFMPLPRKVSPLLGAILRDREASLRLREAIARGDEFTYEKDGVRYTISTSTEQKGNLGDRNPSTSRDRIAA